MKIYSKGQKQKKFCHPFRVLGSEIQTKDQLCPFYFLDTIRYLVPLTMEFF